MNLDRWEIVFARESESDPVGHPAVILSGSDILSDDRQLRFNALMGTKRPPAAKVLPHQVLLDQADGLEFATLINCSLVYVVRKNSILRRAGVVSHVRRAEIARRIRASLCSEPPFWPTEAARDRHRIFPAVGRNLELTCSLMVESRSRARGCWRARLLPNVKDEPRPQRAWLVPGSEARSEVSFRKRKR